MLNINARNMMRSAFPADASGERASEQTAEESIARLERVARERPSLPPWSPIVVAGVVRMLEFLLIVLVGSAMYAVYLFPAEGFQWHYVAAVLGIATLAMLAFQIADIYQVQAFRGYEKQYFRLASAWAVVFLITMSMTFLAKLGDAYSRVWLGSFFAIGLLCLIAFRRIVFLLVRHWTSQGCSANGPHWSRATTGAAMAGSGATDWAPISRSSIRSASARCSLPTASPRMRTTPFSMSSCPGDGLPASPILRFAP